MKRLSPRVFALSLTVALLAATAPVSAVAETELPSDDEPRLTAAELEEFAQLRSFQTLSTGSVDVVAGGNGHGVGMSQYGAMALAQDGKTYEQILEHFYTGIKRANTNATGGPDQVAGTIEQKAHPVFIGIGQNQPSVKFQLDTSLPGAGNTGEVCFGGHPCVSLASGQSWEIFRHENNCVIRSGSTELYHDCSSEGQIGAQIATITWPNQWDQVPGVGIKFDQLTVMTSPTATTTVTNRVFARGSIGVVYAGSGRFHVRVHMGMEEYLYGLAEMPLSWPSDALKAQAVAARSFALAKLSSLRSVCACHLVSSTWDQAYLGWHMNNEGNSTYGQKWRDAVNATAGEALWYYNNKTAVSPNYFAYTGNATENNEDWWGGSPVPYLRSRPDPGAQTFTRTFTSSDFANRLGFGTGGSVELVQILDRYDSGRPVTITVIGKKADGTKLTRQFTASEFSSDLGGVGKWVISVSGDGITFVDGGPPHGALVAYRSSDSLWAVIGNGGSYEEFIYGRPGDVAILGDWDGDGVKTPGLYRQSDGFVYLRNTNSAGWADVSFFFGRSGDIPVVGDFDGDGVDTVSVYRPSDGRFYIKNELNDGWAESAFVYGRPGDIPFAGDWDGKNGDSVGLRRPTDGFVYLKNSNSAGWADVSYFYGRNGDLVFVGDFDANETDGLGVYRPSTGKVYLRNKLSSGDAEISLAIGGGWDAVFFTLPPD